VQVVAEINQGKRAVLGYLLSPVQNGAGSRAGTMRRQACSSDPGPRRNKHPQRLAVLRGASTIGSRQGKQMHAEDEDDSGADAIFVTFEVARQVAIGVGVVLAVVCNTLYFLGVLASSKHRFFESYLVDVLFVEIGLIHFALLLKWGAKRIWTRLGTRAPPTWRQIHSRSYPTLFFLTRLFEGVGVLLVGAVAYLFVMIPFAFFVLL
jgi:hypothetical protein